MKKLFVLFAIVFILFSLGDVFALTCTAGTIESKREDTRDLQYLNNGFVDVDTLYYYKTNQDRGFFPTAPYSIYDSLDLVLRYPYSVCINPTVPFKMKTKRTISLIIDDKVFGSFVNTVPKYLNDDPQNPVNQILSGPLYLTHSKQITTSFDGTREEVDVTEGSENGLTDSYPFRLSWFAKNEDGSINNDKIEELIKLVDKYGNNFLIEVNDSYEWRVCNDDFCSISYGKDNAPSYLNMPKQDPEPITKVFRVPRLSNCYHEWGDGEVRVAYARDNSGINPIELLDYSYNIISGGFSTVQPLKSQFLRFSFFADLSQKPNSVTSFPVYFSSCKDVTKYTLYKEPRPFTSTCGESLINAKFIRVKVNDPQVLVNDNRVCNYPITSVHEFAHNFAGIQDEYYQADKKTAKANCADIDDYQNAFKDGDYSYGKSQTYCSNTKSIRSTLNSIMRGAGWRTNQFNVWSCGTIYSKLTKKSFSDSLKECYSMSQTEESVVYEPRCSDDKSCATTGDVFKPSRLFYGCGKCLHNSDSRLTDCEYDATTNGQICYAEAFKIGDEDKSMSNEGQVGTCRNGVCVDIHTGCVDDDGCFKGEKCINGQCAS